MLADADVAAALAVASRDAVAGHLDRGYGEAIVPERQARGAAGLSFEESAMVGARLVSHLRCDFGYCGLVRRRRQAVLAGPEFARA